MLCVVWTREAVVWTFLCKTTTTFGIIYNMKTETQMDIQTPTLDSHSGKLEVFSSGDHFRVDFLTYSLICTFYCNTRNTFSSELSRFYLFTIFGRNDLAKVDVLHIGMIKSFGLHVANIIRSPTRAVMAELVIV